MSGSKKSIVKRAAVFMTVTLTVFLVGILFLTNMFVQESREDTSARNLDIAHHIAANVTVFTEHQIVELRELRLIIENLGIGKLVAVGKELDRICAFHPLLEAVQVVDEKGDVVKVSPDKPKYVGVDLSRQKIFLSARGLSRDGIYWSEAFKSPQTKNEVVSISMPMKGGALIAYLDLKHLGEIASAGQSMKGETVFLTDKRGVVMGYTDPVMASMGNDLSEHEAIKEALNGKAGTYDVRFGEMRGIISVVPIKESGWVVGVFQGENVALGTIKKIRNTGIAGILLSTIVFLMGIVGLIKTSYKPLRTMEKQVHLIAAGHYEENLDTHFVEFEGLVRAFNQMSAAIRRREENLRTSQERFKTAFMTIPSAVSIVRLEDGRYEDINEGFCKITGWSRDEVVGRISLEPDIWKDNADYQEVIGKIKEGGKCHNLEIAFVRKDGSIFTGLLSAGGIAFGGEPHILLVTRDITELKKAQASLEKTYHLLSTIVDSSPLGIVQMDSAGVIHLWNVSAERIFGWKAEEVLDRKIPFVPEEKREEFENLHERVLAGENIFSFETRGLHKDGGLFDISINLARVVLEAGELEVMGVVEDITERKAAEKALIESEQRSRVISEGVFEGIVISFDGVIIETNRQFADMVGYKPEDLKGMRVLDLVHPDYRETVRENMRMDKVEAYESDVVRGDGAVIRVEVQGNFTTYQGNTVRLSALHDITKKKQAEYVLREREKRYRLLYENNPLSYHSLDADGVILEVNKAWTTLTGYKADEVVGREFMDFVSEDFKDVVRQNFPELLEEGEIEVPAMEILIKDDRKILVSLTGRASIDEETGNMKTHCLLNDITERVRMEEALKKGAQLAAVGQVASGIAHEINNPLATISASTEALLARLPKLQQEAGQRESVNTILALFQEYLMMIMGEVNRSSQIIRDLLDFTRVRDFTYEKTDVRELIQSTVRLLSVQNRMRKHKFEVQLGSGPFELNCDRERLRQVLIILMTNAVESMPEGGVIVISGDADREKEVFQLSFRDSGSGISEEMRQHIFEPFYTTKGPGRGTGLGLSIAENIVSKHKGRIEVLENEDGGTTFRIVLPIAGPSDLNVRG